MSGPLSIFQKVCPSCAAHIAVDADACACGHEFEAVGDNSTSTEEQALRDEELYENYLAARAGQAAEAARAAADWLAEEPDNSDRANAAQLAQEVAASLEADLQQQRAKISAMRRVLPRLRSTPPAAKPAVAATARAAGTNPPAAAPRAVAVNAGTPLSAPPAAPNPAAAPTITAPTPRPAPAAGVAPALPPMASATKAAAALEAIKRAKAREAAAATVTATPPDSFRAEQAARAARAIADKPAAADSKDCPNCTASVPLATTRCRCGFAFVTGTNNLPTLTLCTGDFTALRNSLKLNLGK